MKGTTATLFPPRAGNPGILRSLFFRQSLLRFAGGELFLVLIMILADLFSSMWRFLAMDASFGDILTWVAAGVPAHMAEVLPVAFLFGITLTMAEAYASGELIVIYGSGISVRSLTLPIVAFSVLLAIGSFFVEDVVTIPSSLARDTINRTMTGQKSQGRRVTDITIMTDGGRFVYMVGFFDSTTDKLVDIDIAERDPSGRVIGRILAPRAIWNGTVWMFEEVRVFSESGGVWTERSHPEFSREDLDEPPLSFGLLREKPELMKIRELHDYIAFLKRSGLPTAEAETEYHKRFTFLFTPLIVCGLSLAFAGLFRKNTLLMSLLFSLGTATVYYVAQMLGALSAKTGWIEPFWGIWSVTLVFLAVSFAGYFKART